MRSPFIKRAFELYATGQYSTKQLAKELQSEGFRSKKGNTVPRSAIHSILINPIYHGEFRWHGEIYSGKHEPIISKELYDQVQLMMERKGNHRSRYKKHSWAFQGLIHCGHCGCALTAEMKKGKYVYYRCTGNRGKCPEPYVLERELDRQFYEAILGLRMDEDVLEWTRKALLEGHESEKKYHDEMVAVLQAQKRKLQEWIHNLYIDKVKSLVPSEAFYEDQSEKWRKEETEIDRQLAALQSADQAYLEEGVRLLELVQEGVALYKSQQMAEKRRLLNFVCSNSTWKSGKLSVAYRVPFDNLAVTNAEYKKTQHLLGTGSSKFEKWLGCVRDVRTFFARPDANILSVIGQAVCQRAATEGIF